MAVPIDTLPLPSGEKHVEIRPFCQPGSIRWSCDPLACRQGPEFYLACHSSRHACRECDRRLLHGNRASSFFFASRNVFGMASLCHDGIFRRADHFFNVYCRNRHALAGTALPRSIVFYYIACLRIIAGILPWDRAYTIFCSSSCRIITQNMRHFRYSRLQQAYRKQGR